MRVVVTGLLLALCFCCATAFAAIEQSFTGTYTAKMDDMTITLKLEQHKDWTVTGTMTADGETTRLSGKVNGVEMSGMSEPTNPEEKAELRMHFEGGKLVVEAIVPNGGATQSMTFTRQSSAAPSLPSGGAKPDSGKGKKEDPVEAASTAGPVVRVNRVQLTEAELRRIERESGMRLPAGNYWYDKKCGAWGIEGGPTLGFTRAGVNLGGPLRADASNGHTGVFINGRELHQADVNALLAIGIPVQKGRVWCDAQGNIGPEGSRVILINLVQYLNARAQANRPKGLYHAGAAGYTGSDGQTSYFFDPHGGSVIIGPG